MIHFMKGSGMPNGLQAVGYTATDIPQLVNGAWPQKRVIDNAPKSVTLLYYLQLADFTFRLLKKIFNRSTQVL